MTSQKCGDYLTPLLHFNLTCTYLDRFRKPVSDRWGNSFKIELVLLGFIISILVSCFVYSLEICCLQCGLLSLHT